MDIDRAYRFASMTALSLCSDIESHFEVLLQDLTKAKVIVSQHSKNKKKKTLTVECSSFDYEECGGQQFQGSIDMSSGSKVDYDIRVFPGSLPKKRVRFFKNGRRIGQVSSVQSFMECSELKAKLWDHPSIVGFIEVNQVLNPVLTRDEFVQTASREEAYKLLAGLEGPLMEALDKSMLRNADLSMGELQNLLSKSLNQVLRQDSKAFRVANEKFLDHHHVTDETSTSSTNDTRAPRAPAVKAKTPTVYDIQFVKSEDTQARSYLIDKVISMNTSNLDYQSRLLKDKNGMLKFGPRMASYLANELARYYMDEKYTKLGLVPPEAREELYDDLVTSANRIENVVIRNLGSFKPGGATHNIEEEIQADSDNS